MKRLSLVTVSPYLPSHKIKMPRSVAYKSLLSPKQFCDICLSPGSIQKLHVTTAPYATISLPSEKQIKNRQF